MNTKALRQKILDLAIHGKLVPQDPNDEPASVLLERIKAEKERLIKEGKIKRSKQSKTACDKLHYPFELPDGWCWTTLGEIGMWQSGATPSRLRQDYYGGSIPWLKTGDLNDGIIQSIPENITEKALEETSVKLNPKGSVLMAMYGATIGKVGILSFAATTNQACCACLNYKIEQMYLFYFLLANRENFISMGGGGAQPNISKEKIIQTCIPVPPIDEQKRIINAIDYWISLANSIDNSKENLQVLIKQVKSKILDLAIHGKLVLQDPTDEPAGELLKRLNPKAEITCDNPHYRNLPKGWAICSLEQVANILDNLRKPINSNERNARINNKHESELFPYYGATGQVGFIDDYLIDGSYLLLGEDGAPFLDKNATKAYSIEGKCWVNNHAHILKPLCNFNYLMYYLNQVDYKDYVNGSTRLKLTQSDMRSIKILLPPMAEQERISTKVKELFYLLDNISYFL